MPVYYPKLITAAEGSGYCSSTTANCDDGAEPESAYEGSYPRSYHIRDQQGASASGLPDDARAQLRCWASTTASRGRPGRARRCSAARAARKVVGGRKLFLYAQGGSLTTVAWHTPQGVYWISNTLTTDISNAQMVAIAASLTPGLAPLGHPRTGPAGSGARCAGRPMNDR